MDQMIIKIRVGSSKIGKHGKAMEHAMSGERALKAAAPLTPEGLAPRHISSVHRSGKRPKWSARMVLGSLAMLDFWDNLGTPALSLRCDGKPLQGVKW